MTTDLDMLAYREAAKVLNECSDVSGERMLQHGGIVTEYTRLAKYWSILLGSEVPPHLAIVMMAVHKANRISCGADSHRDHYLDGANYFALAWGVFTTLREQELQNEAAAKSDDYNPTVAANHERMVGPARMR